jgi:hypothetical protein
VPLPENSKNQNTGDIQDEEQNIVTVFYDPVPDRFAAYSLRAGYNADNRTSNPKTGANRNTPDPRADLGTRTRNDGLRG